MKKIVTILRISLFILFGIIALLLIFIQTRPFKNLLRDIIEKKASENLQNAELTIGRIEGSFWGSLRIKNIQLTSDGEKLVSLGEIFIDHSLSAILSKKLQSIVFWWIILIFILFN